MAKVKSTNIIMKSEPSKAMRIFKAGVGVFTAAALWLLLATALDPSVVTLCCALLAAAVAAAVLASWHKKYVLFAVLGAVVLYSVLCISIDVKAFTAGAALFGNGIAASANANVHAGWGMAAIRYSAVAEYLFASVLAVWLAAAVAAVVKRWGYAVIVFAALVGFVLFCIGLYPSLYAVILTVAAAIGILICECCFTPKAILCYALCVTVAVGAIAPVYLYTGSEAIGGLRSSISAAAEGLYYGSDNLPDGKLQDSVGMRDSDKVRLKVTLAARTPTLYLKGFTGSELVGNSWQPTDKNKYVQNGYQGLMEYLDARGMLVTQYAKYLELDGNAERYQITVRNVAASTKYVYAPYAVSAYSDGDQYYDLNLRDGKRDYTFTVADGDKSSERTSQSQWLWTENVRTDAMNAYVLTESEYRAFVYDTYCGIDKKTQAVIKDAMGDIEATSINTVTQITRAFFLGGYKYADRADIIKTDFVTEFFGGNITRASAPYFATAATHIFRMYGYAARYAEGYLVQSDPSNTVDEAVNVTDKNAHAWTEVYFDGMGWLPIEVTPEYFSEELPEVLLDPDNPDAPSQSETPPDPSTPTEDEEITPPTPVTPNVTPTVSKPDPYVGLYSALKVLVPIAAAALGLMLILLAAAVRRYVVIDRKRKKLEEARGSDFGRAAYEIVRRDCRHIGGCDGATLAKYGIAEASSARFMQLIEKSVYGEHDLNANERNVVLRYIDSVASALSAGGGKSNRFVCKYIRCLGL